MQFRSYWIGTDWISFQCDIDFNLLFQRDEPYLKGILNCIPHLSRFSVRSRLLEAYLNPYIVDSRELVQDLKSTNCIKKRDLSRISNYSVDSHINLD